MNTRRQKPTRIALALALGASLWPPVCALAEGQSGPSQISFVEVSSQVGVSALHVGDYGPLWGDLDGTGWVDLVFLNHGYQPTIYMNRDGAWFQNRAFKSGLKMLDWVYPQQADRHGAGCADYDNDGDVDWMIAHGAKKGETLGVKWDELLRNRGDGKFEDVSEAAGTANRDGRSRLPTWADYDADGWVDLYVGNFASPNVLYRNLGDGTFADTSAASGLDLGQQVRPGWSDFDGDGDPDVASVWPLHLARNEGDGTFSDATHAAGLWIGRVKGPNGIAWGDYDNDDDPDLFVVSRNHRSLLYRNDDGVFARTSGEFGPYYGEEGTGAVWGDADNDGDLDLVVASTLRVRLFENLGGDRFSASEIPLAADTKLDVGADVAMGDYDGDGGLDLAINGLERHLLLANRTPERGSWLSVALEGSASNRMGLGARVRVSGPGVPGVAMREFFGDNGSFKSSGCGPLHFGLGSASSVRVEVRWPSGQVTELDAVTVNRSIRIVEAVVDVD